MQKHINTQCHATHLTDSHIDNPVSNIQLYKCDKCSYETLNKRNYNNHMTSNKHMKKTQDTGGIYICECCNYNTIHKHHYNNHMLSRKHKKIVIASKLNIKTNQCALCFRQYSCKSSLSRHKQKCRTTLPDDDNVEPIADSDDYDSDNGDDDYDSESDNDSDNESVEPEREIDNANADSSGDSDTDESSVPIKSNAGQKDQCIGITPEMFMELFKQNSEFKTIIIEQQKFIMEKMLASGSTAHSYNNNTTNSHNKTFNIQLFLNEHCKDAIDINEFVRTLDYSSENLESNMRLGYTGGISKMLTDTPLKI